MRKKLDLFASLVCLSFVVVLGCGGLGGSFDGGGSGDGPSNLSMTGFEPCNPVPGKLVRVYGDFVVGTPVTIQVNGKRVDSAVAGNGYADFTFPIGEPVDSEIDAFQGTKAGTKKLTLGFPDVVTEREPNDDTAGGNATPAGDNRTASGTLSNPLDKDHFTFDCVQNKTMRVKVDPPIVDTVYVNGTAVFLDAMGEGVFKASTDRILVGLTGATGTYTITLSPGPIAKRSVNAGGFESTDCPACTPGI